MSRMSYEEACDRGYDGPSPAQERRMRRRYSCGGYASYTGHCGATDCATCYPGSWDQDDDEERIEEATTSKVVTARKARPGNTRTEIRPGDRVRVTSGFAYEVDGPRMGYLPKRYTRLAKGPNWNTDTVATVGV